MPVYTGGTDVSFVPFWSSRFAWMQIIMSAGHCKLFHKNATKRWSTVAVNVTLAIRRHQGFHAFKMVAPESLWQVLSASQWCWSPLDLFFFFFFFFFLCCQISQHSTNLKREAICINMSLINAYKILYVICITSSARTREIMEWGPTAWCKIVMSKQIEVIKEQESQASLFLSHFTCL